MPGARRAVGFSEKQDAFGDDTLNRRETLELVRAYYKITDSAVRKRVFDLIKSLVPEGN
jgi:ABC-type multidrug transport system ATPase subunit